MRICFIRAKRTYRVEQCTVDIEEASGAEAETLMEKLKGELCNLRFIKRERERKREMKLV